MSAEAALMAAKAALRARAQAARKACDPAVGAALAARLLAAAPPPPGAVIAGVWPMRSEIDLRPLLAALSARGHPLALPATPTRGEALRFHRWRPGEALRAGPFGTSEPAGAAAVCPDWVLVPLLAFDRAGRRLGYGGGFYDRTLAALPDVVAIGCAFAAQELAAIPTGPADIRLPRIVTEAELIVCAP